MTILVLVLNVVLEVFAWAWLLAWFMSDRYARGTQGRFVCRSVQRPTQWLTLVYYAMILPPRFLNQEWLSAWIGVVAFSILLWSIWKFYHNDDEDDFWKRLKKKVRKLVRAAGRRARAMVPSPLVPIPVAGGA